MSSTPKRKRTIRPCKRKLPGSDISIPSNPPIHIIEAEIKSMISSGRFTLGEECAPYKITKYTLVDGTMTPHDTFVQARKVPLNEIRQRILDKHLKYMRLTPSSTVTAMTEREIKDTLSGHYSNLELMNSCASSSLSLRDPDPYACGMTRKMGFLMVTVHVMYDPLVFLTDDEYQQCHPVFTFSLKSNSQKSTSCQLVHRA